jgi:hypothetical protein
VQPHSHSDCTLRQQGLWLEARVVSWFLDHELTVRSVGIGLNVELFSICSSLFISPNYKSNKSKVCSTLYSSSHRYCVAMTCCLVSAANPINKTATHSHFHFTISSGLKPRKLNQTQRQLHIQLSQNYHTLHSVELYITLTD